MQRISIIGKLNNYKKISTVDCMLSWRFASGARGKGGFTLLELIVVCALIGIMLSLSIPSFRTTFFSDPLKTTARRLIGLVNGVRELAVREQQPYLLHINQGEKRIWYEREDKKEETAKTHIDILDNYIAKSGHVSSVLALLFRGSESHSSR